MCVYIYIHTHHILFIYSSVNGHLGCYLIVFTGKPYKLTFGKAL